MREFLFLRLAIRELPNCDVERRFSADRVKLAERSSGPQAKKSQ